MSLLVSLDELTNQQAQGNTIHRQANSLRSCNIDRSDFVCRIWMSLDVDDREQDGGITEKFKYGTLPLICESADLFGKFLGNKHGLGLPLILIGGL